MIVVEKVKLLGLLERGLCLVLDVGNDDYSRIVEWDDDGFSIGEGFEVIRWADADVEKIFLVKEAYHPCREVFSEEVVEERDNGVTRKHPSQGLVRFSRVSGHAQLFDSKMHHQHFVTLTISSCDVNEDSYSRRFAERKQLFEVWMSEVQFARAITSLNCGSGTPCSLHRINGDVLPVPPVRDSPLIKHRGRLDEMRDSLTSMLDEPLELLRELSAERKRPTLKQLDELIFRMENAAGNAGSNAKFAHQVLEEAMEESVAECKTEVDGYVHHTLVEAGLQSVTSSFDPLRMDGPDSFIDHEALESDDKSV